MRRELTAQVGADGVLNLTVPLGPECANQTVRVVVEAVPTMSQEEWHRFVTSIAGQWQGDFERDQGEHQERDPL